MACRSTKIELDAADELEHDQRDDLEDEEHPAAQGHPEINGDRAAVRSVQLNFGRGLGAAAGLSTVLLATLAGLLDEEPDELVEVHRSVSIDSYAYCR